MAQERFEQRFPNKKNAPPRVRTWTLRQVARDGGTTYVEIELHGVLLEPAGARLLSIELSAWADRSEDHEAWQKRNLEREALG